MNNINKILGYILFLVMMCSCDSFTEVDREFQTYAKIYLINESSSVVKSRSTRCFDYEIQPGDTLVHYESFSFESKEKITTKTYQPFATCYMFYYVDGDKCEYGLRQIKNYDYVKEVSDSKFELLFRFTDQRKNSLIRCDSL